MTGCRMAQWLLGCASRAADQLLPRLLWQQLAAAQRLLHASSVTWQLAATPWSACQLGHLAACCNAVICVPAWSIGSSLQRSDLRACSGMRMPWHVLAWTLVGMASHALSWRPPPDGLYAFGNAPLDNDTTQAGSRACSACPGSRWRCSPSQLPPKRCAPGYATCPRVGVRSCP